ncbi:hypothetical protein GQ53DRAFT_780705 [Thozetella sp. PMI_491]|nr:hypothetical protein GQ53DRAFT_780705 [Thozetella sp. PMI_491]
MATATLISPSNAYQPYHAPSFSSGYHAPPPPPPPPSQAPSIHSMVSPAEPPRRTSDEPEIPHRQSLPSIQEVISGTKGPQYPHSAPPTGPPAPSLPSPFSTSAPSRPYGETTTDPNPSPRTLHPTSNYPRPEPTPAFSDPARHAVSGRPAPPPLNTFPASHPSPPRNEPEPRHPEPHSSFPHASQPQPPLYAHTGRLPPGQLPLTGYDVSPRQGGHALPSPYEAQRPPIYEEGDYVQRPNEYKSTVDRAFEAWSYAEALSDISTSARTIFGFADAFDAAAREQQGQRSIPSRLPLENEVTSIIETALHVKKKLEEVRDMVQQNRLNHERARASGGRKPYDDEDMPMYNDGMKQPFTLNEVKKRRGRAAPPGRCHSCNRVDTPEWRRGPDGARTLCNACGLHYAKLERKRQLEQRNIRPKPSDDRN